MVNSKNILVFIILMYSNEQFHNKVLADDIIDCSSVDLVTSVFNDPIELNSTGTIKVYENVAINEIVSTSNNEFDVKYLEARLEIVVKGTMEHISKNLVIYTTENFPNYAKEQSAARISLKINLACGMGKERIIVFFQPLKEANYYSPIFSQSLYELTMPTPIFSGYDLTSFIDISARDDDLTNNQINFTSITSSQYYISVGTKNVTSDDKKTYFANLTLERIYLELTQQIEFVIIATDNGIPPRTSNASVIIRSDPRHSLPVLPRFEQKLYKGYINVVFSMEPIPIKLSQESYDPQVTFSLSGAVMEGFEMLDTGNGSIEILWNATKVNQTYIMARKQWQLEVTAEHPNLAESSVATILVELVDFQRFFHFMSLYYDGRIETDDKLYMTPIIFYPFVYKPDINFTFLENPLNMFALTNEGFRVDVQLMPNFTLNAFANNSFLKLALQASWDQLSTVCYIIIELPSHRSTSNQQQMFQFEKPLYVGNLTELNAVEMEAIVLQTDANATQLNEFQLIGEWSHLFRLDVNGSHVKLEVDFTQNTTAINLKSPILLVLEASDSISKAFTSLVINTRQKTNPIKSRDIFMSRTVRGKILLTNNIQILTLDSIDLQPVENLRNYQISLHRNNISQYFELQTNVTALQLQLILKDPLPNTTLEANHFLVLSIAAKLNESTEVTDTLIVFIELPIKECPETLPTLLNPPSFTNDNYVFSTLTGETGSLGFVNAHVKGSNATLHYILEVQNDTLAQSLSVNPFSGELLLYSILGEGSYKFNITAENVETHEKVRVQALLKVHIKEECKIYEGPAVEKTLVVKHIDEERGYHGLWNMTYTDNCTFHILEMWPKDKAYVYVNFTSHMLDILAVDREDLVFKDMIEAEIIVKFRLLCGDNDESEDNISGLDVIESNRTQVARSIEWPFDDVLYSQDMVFAPDIMWLHLKIDDINDNAPQFAMSTGPQYLGYPSGKVALDVYPECLTQIMASDRDLGLNAKIRYTIRENEYFAIEPDTGKIYPKGRILQPHQQTELIILAVDQDGKGLMSGTVVIVKGLAADYYSLVTIEGNSSKSLQDVSQELSAEMGCDVKILKMSYVPQMEARAGRGHGLVCKAWIYAYRNQELVQCNELQEKFLKNSPVPSIVNIESYEEAGLQSNIKRKNPSTVGYIVAVSLLSVISCSSIVFIIWRFYYYNGTESGCDTKGSLSTHHLQQSPGQHRGNGQPSECSYGDNNTNHVKFSSLVDNVNCD